MSIIYSIVCSLVLFHAILAALPPKDVYSAVIINKQGSPVDCQIVWTKPNGHTLESNLFTINENKKHLVKEHIIDVETWQARAAIEQVRCGKLTLKAPFEGVHSPKLNWKFIVTPNEIISGDAN